jgi:beta-lactam-binding protein with PASTA domain
MPKLVGMRLSAAEEKLDSLGVLTVNARDALPEDRIPLMSRNWVVTTQSHKPGTLLGTSTPVTLTVKKPSDGQGSSHVSPGTVPDVVCMDLQAAQDSMQEAGFYNLGSDDVSGQGRLQILDRNWVVVSQSVRAGTQPSELRRIVLTSVKFGEPTGSSKCRS